MNYKSAELILKLFNFFGNTSFSFYEIPDEIKKDLPPPTIGVWKRSKVIIKVGNTMRGKHIVPKYKLPKTICEICIDANESGNLAIFAKIK